MLKQKYFLTDFFILSAEKQPIKLSWRNIEWLLIYLEYTSLIRDLLYYIPLAVKIYKGNPLTYEELMDYTFSQYDYVSANNQSQYTLQKSIILQVQEFNPDDNLEEKLESVVEKRLTFRTNLYQLKKELIEVTHCQKKQTLIMSKLGNDYGTWNNYNQRKRCGHYSDRSRLDDAAGDVRCVQCVRL